MSKDAHGIFNSEQIEKTTETTIVCCFARGAFHSSVYGCLTTDNQAVAVKVYDREASKSRGERIISEKTVLTRLSLLSHPCITQLIRTTKDDQHLYFILEAHLGNHLQAHITVQNGFSLIQTRFYTAEVMLALLFLARQGVVHRDIKSKNVLLDANGHVKLCDFGLAKVFIDTKRETNHDDNIQNDASNKALEGRLYSVVGTLPYMAPEMIAKRGYAMEIDWYSMGVLMYEMMCGEFPVYKNDYRKFTQTLPDEYAITQARLAVDCCTEMVSEEEGGEWMPLVQGKEHIFHCSEEHQACWDLIMALLQASPSMRLGPNQKESLFSHRFFSSLSNDFDWTGIRNKTTSPPSFNSDISFIDIFDMKKPRKQEDNKEQLLNDDINLFSNF